MSIISANQIKSISGTARNVDSLQDSTQVNAIADSKISTLTNQIGADTGASLVGFKANGIGAVATTVQSKLRESVSVKDFGAVGDGVTDDTAAIQAAHAASDHVYYPDGTYMVTMANNAALVTFTSRSNIRISGQAATIYDPRVYTGDPIAPVFDFIGCQNVAIDLNYEGAALVTPESHLGYLGGTFARWRKGSDNLRIKATINNARYGVLSGSYSDTSHGGNKNITADLRTTMCGYPVAFYDVTGVAIDIYADGVHRAAYLAGVQDGYVSAKWRNQYIADISVLFTEALVSGPGLKGCRNLKIQSFDLGSSVFETSSACCGMLPNRNAYPVTHSNIYLEFHVVSTDAISTNVGGFKLGGGSGSLPNGEPYAWEQTVELENIYVSGVIDRSGQTLESNAAGDIYWNSNDTGIHYATVRNVSFSGVTITPSVGSTRDCYFLATGLQDAVTFHRFTSSGDVGVNISFNAGARAIFDSCVIPKFVQGGTVGSIEMISSTASSMPSALTSVGQPITSSKVNGAGMTLRYKEVTLTLTGASTTWTNAIPLGAVVMGCVSRIQTTITGATGYYLGTASDSTRWANTNNLTSGLSTTPTNYGAAALSPQVYTTTTSILVTAKTSNFTGGQLKISLWYFDTTGPTV